MEVSFQLHALATLPPGKRAPDSLCIGGWMEPTSGLDSVEKRTNPNIAVQGTEPRSSSP
jgi:hypothetical protein